MGPTPDQVTLIRQYEPVLYFSGAPGAPGSERFFPSDAKRYVEHAALYLANAPFATRANWGTPVVAAGQLAAINGEALTFFGQRVDTASPQYPYLQTNAGQEHFLDVSGWKPDDAHVDLDRLASLYATDQGLNNSQFWYHAEFLDAARLDQLFVEAVRSGSAIDLTTLFKSQAGAPPVLKDPALICYYLFYPAHEESLSGCEMSPGKVLDTALDFASFAGEWSCIALMLDRPSAASPYTPKWVGLTNRNVGMTSVGNEEVRSTMRVLPWGAMQPYQTTHPRLYVGQGSHGLYLPGELPPPLSFDDPAAASCGGGTFSDFYPNPPGTTFGDDALSVEILIAKAIAGAATGGGLGPFGAILGSAAGLLWGIAEFGSNPLEGNQLPLAIPTGTPTTDTIGSSGFVVYPKGLPPPPEVDPTRAIEWRSEDGLSIAGRKYFFTVDRATQVLWGDDPDHPGYNGRWGAHVAKDPQTRRSGMTFPTFWQLFFETLVRNAPPEITIVLNGNAAPTWTVPNDWDPINNTVECIGGGVGGGVSIGGGAFHGGGGGAYAKGVNLAWSPGQTINIAVGGAADNLGNAGDTYLNPSAASFPVSGQAVGAKGATGFKGGSFANSYATGLGNAQNAGGDGGASSWGAGGGGGAGGPNGPGAAGGTTNPGGVAGSGGGGGSGGAPGASTSADDPGPGGAGSDGSGGGGAGAALPPGTPGAGFNGTELDGSRGSGGGGGGGSGDPTDTIDATAGANGGRYGGGGGAGGSRASIGGTPGGKGADGIIIIRYVPTS